MLSSISLLYYLEQPMLKTDVRQHLSHGNADDYTVPRRGYVSVRLLRHMLGRFITEWFRVTP